MNKIVHSAFILSFPLLGLSAADGSGCGRSEPYAGQNDTTPDSFAPGEILGLNPDTGLSGLSDAAYCEARDNARAYLDEYSGPSQAQICYLAGQIEGMLGSALDPEEDYETLCEGGVEDCLATEPEDSYAADEPCSAPSDLEACTSSVEEVELCLEWFSEAQRAFWEDVEEDACTEPEPGSGDDGGNNEEGPCDDICLAFNPGG